ncbi:MAG TPA: DNA-binding response regulator [Pseudomonas sp.]|nr:DNA-binding response regulator [Pseudomonas sp.]
MLNAVIVVDDEASIRTAVEQWLSLSGFEVQLFSRAEECLAQLPKDFAGVILSDVRMPGLSGLELLAEVQRRDADLPVILLTGHGDVPMAVEAMREGAYDFLEKPFSPDALLNSLRRALDKRGLILENRRLHQQADAKAQLESSLLGVSRGLQNLRRQVLDLASLPVNVLIRGETGSGKELVARCLHDFGPRAKKPFVALNCAAIPEQLFEAELFGHESGAFTGAQGKRIGKLEYAHGGTLFLDEIESMPLAQQVKLLRVLETGLFMRVGTNREIASDVRVVAATNRNPEEAVAEGKLREDLFHRLDVVRIRIPPLRERRDDVPLLFAHFLARACERLNTPQPAVDDQVRWRLLNHDWPGNVRELGHYAQRVALGLADRGLDVDPGAPLPLPERVAAYEAHLIQEALLGCKGDVRGALERLKIPRKTFYDKVERHGLDLSSYRRER